MLLYLKHAFNVSDEELVERWSENVACNFSGMEYYTAKLPCDATQIGRFRQVLGKAGVEELLKANINAAVEMKAVHPSEFERVTVDTTAWEIKDTPCIFHPPAPYLPR
jgi:IS5 family transposase